MSNARKRAAKPPKPTGPQGGASADATERDAARPPRVKYELTGNKLQVEVPYEGVLDAFGTSSPPFARAELDRLMGALQKSGESYASEEAMNAAIAVVAGTRPENEAAAMLASQMAVTHDLAMNLLGRTRRAETLEHVQAFGTLLTKLQRTFTLQIEALAKIKRGGEQTVRVEHVHVYHGGQAIVGQVTAKREGGRGQ